MGVIEVSHLSWSRPGGAPLLTDVSFRVGDGEHSALVGANGVGKTTLLRLLTGEATGHTGTVRVDGHLGVMSQLVGSIRDDTTVRDLLVTLAAVRVRRAALHLAAAERAMVEHPGDVDVSVRYAQALTDWGEAGGYQAEIFWDACTTRAFGEPLDRVADRPAGWPTDRSRPCREASKRNSPYTRSCTATPTSSSSTSPTTSSISWASAGWRMNCAAAARPSSM